MIRYANGEEARPGDRVDLDGYPGVVEAAIDAQAEQAAWGVAERGLMVLTEAFGLMFRPVDWPDWPEVVLLARAEHP